MRREGVGAATAAVDEEYPQPEAGEQQGTGRARHASTDDHHVIRGSLRLPVRTCCLLNSPVAGDCGGAGVGDAPLVATVCTPVAPPLVAAMRLRGGNASSVRGAASLLAEALHTARAAGTTGPILVRADSQYYVDKLVSAAHRAGAMVSITMPTSPAMRAAIGSVPDDRWRPVAYPEAVLDPDTGELISDVDVAETSYTAFAGTRHEVTGRLCV